MGVFSAELSTHQSRLCQSGSKSPWSRLELEPALELELELDPEPEERELELRLGMPLELAWVWTMDEAMTGMDQPRDGGCYRAGVGGQGGRLAQRKPEAADAG